MRDLLLKEYDIMRNEVRLYITKYYIAITLIFTSLIANLFNIKLKESTFIFILTPFIISGLIGFMTMVTFFLNKVASYVRLIEWRLARSYNTVPPDKEGFSAQASMPLTPLLWESYYADIGMERDEGKQFASTFFLSISAMSLAGTIALAIIIYKGAMEAIAWTPFGIPGYISCIFYVVLSLETLFFSVHMFQRVNTQIRQTMRRVNGELLNRFMPTEGQSSE